MKKTIKVLDSVHSRAHRDLVPILRPCLKYQKKTWRKYQKGRYSLTRDKFFIKANGLFLTGFMPRVVDYLTGKGIDPDIHNLEAYGIKAERNPLMFTDLVPRDVQIRALSKWKRGVIQGPTAIGKSFIMALKISMHPSARILVLSHRVDIINQLMEDIQKYRLSKNYMRYRKGLDFGNSRIVLSTSQTFANVPMEEHADRFDMIFIDEVHHVTKLDGQYGKILQSSLATAKLGLSANLPESDTSKLIMEGLVGPVVDVITIEESSQKGYIAKVKMELLCIPKNEKIDARKWKDYASMYTAGVVNNRTRNRMILEKIQHHAKHGRTSLIMVERLKHGRNLMRLAEAIGFDSITFVRGKTSEAERERVKQLLNEKKYSCVISSQVWREGINIPTLDVVANAMGFKAETMTNQAAGRGLRVTNEKKVMYLIDCLDPYRWLSEHSIQRLQIYVAKGWLKGPQVRQLIH